MPPPSDIDMHSQRSMYSSPKCPSYIPSYVPAHYTYSSPSVQNTAQVDLAGDSAYGSDFPPMHHYDDNHTLDSSHRSSSFRRNGSNGRSGASVRLHPGDGRPSRNFTSMESVGTDAMNEELAGVVDFVKDMRAAQDMWWHHIGNWVWRHRCDDVIILGCCLRWPRVVPITRWLSCGVVMNHVWFDSSYYDSNALNVRSDSDGKHAPCDVPYVLMIHAINKLWWHGSNQRDPLIGSRSGSQRRTIGVFLLDQEVKDISNLMPRQSNIIFRITGILKTCNHRCKYALHSVEIW